jgi:hypothetical protein
MTFRTADEAKADYIRRMGAPLGELYHALWQEVAWLYIKWEEYVGLFGTKPSRIELLNRAAPSFFRIVEDSMWDDVTLHVARLTDPPKSKGRANLTIQRLPNLVDHLMTRDALASLIATAIGASDFCRDWRNRRIAHRDLNLALERGAEPLKPASREKMRAALSSIVGVLNVISVHYLDSTSFFENGARGGGAISLLYVIDDGLTAQSEQRDRRKRGEFRDDDFRPKDL